VTLSTQPTSAEQLNAVSRRSSSDILSLRVIHLGDVYRARNPASGNTLRVQKLVLNSEGGERIECLSSSGRTVLVDPYRLSRDVSRGYERLVYGDGPLIWNR